MTASSSTFFELCVLSSNLTGGLQFQEIQRSEARSWVVGVESRCEIEIVIFQIETNISTPLEGTILFGSALLYRSRSDNSC